MILHVPINRLLKSLSLALAATLFIPALTGCRTDDRTAAEDGTSPYVAAASDVEAGRYVVIVGGCNDCHTDGYLQTEGKIPEEDWLTGSSIGWQGPWGTTYPKNLRLTVQDRTEDEWVQLLHTRTALPPMPWMNVNRMSEKDARSLYRYVKSLGPAGSASPAPLAPGVEPDTPYLVLEPQHMERMAPPSSED